jgi:hypothetical protein
MLLGLRSVVSIALSIAFPVGATEQTDALLLPDAAPTEKEWHLHPILLAGWGTPIGELFDLQGLSKMCRKNQRWSFFFTSAPLNYTGAVASPPNAIAIM